MLMSFVDLGGIPLMPLHLPPAYLDPGSGSYLIQLLAAGLLGGLFVLRLSWGRIRAFFARRRGRKQEGQADE
jgi:hypothetical protein